MMTRGIITFLLLIFASVLTFSACDVTSEKGLDESMEIVPNVELVKGGENVTMKVNKGESNNSYFSIELSNINKNSVISNGEREAWCIVYDKPLNSDGGMYDGTKLYNTYGDESFKPLNHFLNERYILRNEYSQLTWKEEQVIIWAVMDKHNPFDVDKVDVTSLSRLHTNGQPLFDKELVKVILAKLKSEVDSFEYKPAQVYAIAGETGEGNQPVIFVKDTMFAYGGQEGDFICAFNKNRWAWFVEFDGDNFIYNGNNSPLNETPFIAGSGGGNRACGNDYSSGGTEVGTLKAELSNGFLDLTYTANDDYAFADPHVLVSCSIKEIENQKGNPPGGGNYLGLNDLTGHNLTSDDQAFTQETFTVDVSQLNCKGSYYIVAHAGNF